MKIDSSNEIKAVLERNVETIIEKENLFKSLSSGKRLRIKHGIDPTGPKIHIGRAVVLNKLAEFQRLGHKAILIIGDFTAQIGDPSDKLDKRPMIGAKEIKSNLKNYLSQIGKIINIKKAEIHYNSKWLSKLSFTELMKLTEIFSVRQMLERRNFKDRLESHKEISLRELFYPIMQGYDSVAVRADVEIGGSDQLFNLTAGRRIQEFYKMKPQDILTTQMLEGTDGRKMSTSWGNVINIIDSPNDMFGKVMSLNDSLLEKYLFLATDFSENEILKIIELPKIVAKERLAHEITRRYHGEKLSEKAKSFFIGTFRQKNLPDDIDEIKLGKEKLSDALIKKGLVSSMSEYRRLIHSGAIEFEKESVTDPSFKPTGSGVLRIGKKKFVKIV